MNVAQQAGRILTAWSHADSHGFKQELESALSVSASANRAKLDLLEYERREVLDSVVERLRASEKSSASQTLHAGFVLLEHLSQRAATA